MHSRKIILCVCWTGYQVVLDELQAMGQTIIADLYSQLLERVQQELQQKEPALVYSSFMITPDRISRGRSGTPYSDLVGKLSAILATHLTIHHPITTSSTSWTIIFVENFHQ
ncbi:uncharacterized protein NPIL_485031 [Nephila pilipes]|uniref:Uncharacterized protein n=1 Tax=Nephila pilipes TaxID=299642 RepID=A0A8X6PS47_NEPPI|nr:uncharacterized protein NPIL_485031 [Nephila pilipes]